MTPTRVQRRRTRGWRMPVGAVYVGRPSRWGNPYQVGGVDDHGQPITSHAQAVDLFTAMLNTPGELGERMAARVRAELGGKSLACWCPPGTPCHADVLLRIANTGNTP